MPFHALPQHLLARPDFAELLHARTKTFMAGCAAVVYGGTEFAQARNLPISPHIPPDLPRSPQNSSHLLSWAQADGYWGGLERRVSNRVLQVCHRPKQRMPPLLTSRGDDTWRPNDATRLPC